MVFGLASQACVLFTILLDRSFFLAWLRFDLAPSKKKKASHLHVKRVDVEGLSNWPYSNNQIKSEQIFDMKKKRMGAQVKQMTFRASV